MTYEQALIELEELLSELQEGATDIDGLEKKVARAAELIAWCRARLRTVEGQLDQLDQPETELF